MTARSTDGRQVALLRADGTIGLYSTHGALLRTVTPSSAVEVALRRDYLAVLTKTRTLEVFNSHSGRKLRSWHVTAGAAHLDLAAGLAAIAAGRRVHVVKLSTGEAFSARAPTRPSRPSSSSPRDWPTRSSAATAPARSSSFR